MKEKLIYLYGKNIFNVPIPENKSLKQLYGECDKALDRYQSYLFSGIDLNDREFTKNIKEGNLFLVNLLYEMGAYHPYSKKNYADLTVQEGHIHILNWFETKDILPRPSSMENLNSQKMHQSPYSKVVDWLKERNLYIERPRLLVVPIENNLYQAKDNNLVLKQVGPGEFACIGHLDTDEILPLIDEQIDWCRNMGLNYIAN